MILPIRPHNYVQSLWNFLDLKCIKAPLPPIVNVEKIMRIFPKIKIQHFVHLKLNAK